MNVDVNDIKENDIITVFYKDYDRTLQKLFNVKVIEVKNDCFFLEEPPKQYPCSMIYTVYKKDIIMLKAY